MTYFEVFFIAIGLGMDACSVAICKGLAMAKIEWRKAFKIAIYFGTFQTIMPIIGYLIGRNFEDLIERIDHWLVFFLLSGIGMNLIKDSFKDDKEENNSKVDFKNLICLAIATSIDALAIGISFSFLKIDILKPASIIGIVAFVMSFAGVAIGEIIGDKFNKKAQITGGTILIFMGAKILIEHLFFM